MLVGFFKIYFQVLLFLYYYSIIFLCRYVKEEIRTKYGLTELKVPNTLWHYTLKPKVHTYSHSPSSAGVSTPISTGDRRALITNFTKVMTPEEKKRQWEAYVFPSS